MAAQSEIRIRCSPPHREFFAVTAVTCISIGVWLSLSSDFSSVAIGLLILISVIAIIWFFGIYVPNRSCEYEITDSEIRILKSSVRSDTIPFSSIIHVRRLGRSFVLYRSGAGSVYIYPGDANAQIRDILEGITSSEQDGAGQPPARSDLKSEDG